MENNLELRRARAERLVTAIIDSAIKVHRELGPGLLESVYQKCLLIELRKERISAEAEVPVGLIYGSEEIDIGFRADIIVDNLVLVELKSVDKLIPLNMAQTITYLKLTHLPIGLLMNFNVGLLKDGIRRVVHPDQLRRSSGSKIQRPLE